MLPVGSHFSTSALSAIKSSIRNSLHIDNTQYRVLLLFVSIINTIFPIVGGMFLDLFGSIWGTMVVNGLVILKSLLTALAAQFASFPLMIFSLLLTGIGEGLIVTMQESVLSKWFCTQSLSITIGIQLSISRLSTFLCTLSANPVAQSTGDWAWSFWLVIILCGFSISMNAIYAIVMRRLEGTSVVTEEDVARLKKKNSFKYKLIMKFPVYFWVITVIEFIFAAVWSSFQTISTDLVENQFGAASVLAGYTASTLNVVPIVLTPLLEIFIDLYDHRIKILTCSGIFLIICAVLLGYTFANPMAGMVLYSFSLACGTIPMITSIGMVLSSDYIGTGLDIYKSSNNIGSAILDIIVGLVQDRTAGHSYSGVMTLYLVLACIGLGFVIVFFICSTFIYD
ncbi:major facilitator superfamily domain-containing protein [Circinella umbellata]|nr:major facilitator superfamily domain-containing protein [Circinella umbellata]